MSQSEDITFLFETLEESWAETGTLSRGVLTDADILIVPGRHATTIGDAMNGNSLVSRERDWLIRCDQLTNLTTPAEGDTLTVLAGAKIQTWTVTRPDFNTDAVAYLDHAENIARVHVRLTSTAPV